MNSCICYLIEITFFKLFVSKKGKSWHNLRQVIALFIIDIFSRNHGIKGSDSNFERMSHFSSVSEWRTSFLNWTLSTMLLRSPQFTSKCRTVPNISKYLLVHISYVVSAILNNLLIHNRSFIFNHLHQNYLHTSSHNRIAWRGIMFTEQC